MADRLNTPALQAPEWHLRLNENFEFLETAVEIRDAEANLQTHDPVDGAKFVATDTGARYFGDGTNWTLASLKASSISENGNQVYHEGNLDPATSSELSSHVNDTTNPHSVTASQVGAATDTALSNHVNDTTNPHSVTTGQIGAATDADLSSHTSSTSNPHSVTASQVGAPSLANFTNHTGDTTNPHSVTASQAGALPLSGGTVTGPTAFDETTDHRDGLRVKNFAHKNIDSVGVNEDRTDIRFEWTEKVSMVLDVHVQISTTSVGTRNYVHKRFYLATYETVGEIFAQQSYIPDAMSAGDGNYDYIGDFEEAADGTDLILPIYHSHARNVTFNLEFLGNDPSFMDGITVQSGLTRGTMPDQQHAETAPSMEFGINGDLRARSRIITESGGEDQFLISDNETFDGLLGHYFATYAGAHLPLVLRTDSLNTLVAESGDVSVPNGDLTTAGTSTAAAYSTGNYDIEEDADGALSVTDSSTGAGYIRQPADGPTELVQGADIGSIEAPEDTLTQLVNASSTAGATAGDEVGYTFSLNSQTAVAVKGEADGSGGITNVSFELHSETGQVAEIDSTGNLRIAGEIEEGATFT